MLSPLQQVLFLSCYCFGASALPVSGNLPDFAQKIGHLLPIVASRPDGPGHLNLLRSTSVAAQSEPLELLEVAQDHAATTDAHAEAAAADSPSPMIIGVAVGGSVLVVGIAVAVAIFVKHGQDRREGQLLFAETKPTKQHPHGAAFRQKLLLGSTRTLDRGENSPQMHIVVTPSPAHDDAHSHGSGIVPPGTPARSPLTRAATAKSMSDRSRLEAQATEKVRNALTIEARYTQDQAFAEPVVPPAATPRPTLEAQPSSLGAVPKCQRDHPMGRDVSGTRNKPHCTLCGDKISAKAIFFRCQCTTACQHCAALLGGPVPAVTEAPAASPRVFRI